MSNQIRTREQLKKITQAIAMSIDHGRLSEELEEAGLAYEIDETDARDQYANGYYFYLGGANPDDEDGDGIELKVALVEVNNPWASVNVTAQKRADEETTNE